MNLLAITGRYNRRTSTILGVERSVGSLWARVSPKELKIGKGAKELRNCFTWVSEIRGMMIACKPPLNVSN